MLGLWWFSHWRAKQHDCWLLGVCSDPRKVHIKWPLNSRKPLLTDKNGTAVVRIKRTHARGWMRQFLWRRHGWRRWGLQEGTGQAGGWRFLTHLRSNVNVACELGHRHRASLMDPADRFVSKGVGTITFGKGGCEEQQQDQVCPLSSTFCGLEGRKIAG